MQENASVSTAGGYSIERYGARNWAVLDQDEQLVVVAVYKKGAKEVVRRLAHESVDLRSAPVAREPVKSAE